MTASERYDLALYARLAILEADPIFVRAIEQRRLQMLAAAAGGA